MLSEHLKTNKKIGFIGILFSLLIFVPVGSYWQQSILPTDPFWRYQGILLARHIEASGHFGPSLFPDHSYLLRWTNSFTDNITAPIVVVFVSNVSGITITKVSNFPLFTVALIFSTAVVAKRLVKNQVAFALAILFGVVYKFRVLPLYTTAHRGAAGWALFFTILAFILISADKKRELTVGAIVLFAPFIMATHTLPLSGFVFFTSVVILGYISGNKIIPLRLFAIMIVLVLFYYAILNKWVGLVILKFIGVLKIVNISTYTEILRNPISIGGGTVHPLLNQYKIEPPSNTSIYTQLYSVALKIGSVSAVVLTASAVVNRGLNIVSSNKDRFELEPIDVVFISFSIQGFADVLVQPLFGGSGGISPIVLGLMITPIFGTYTVLSTLKWRRVTISPIRIALIGLIVLSLIIAPFYGMTYRSHTDGFQLITTDKSDRAQLEWSHMYLESSHRIISDFNTLSKFYAYGSTGLSYLPPPGAPAYSTKKTATQVIRLYYNSPAQTASDHGQVYIVSSDMKRQGMIHLGSVGTRPNPALDQSMSNDKSWVKVYSGQDNSVFVKE